MKKVAVTLTPQKRQELGELLPTVHFEGYGNNMFTITFYDDKAVEDFENWLQEDFNNWAKENTDEQN